MNTDWIYYGLFLTNKSRENLIKYLKSDNAPEGCAHSTNRYRCFNIKDFLIAVCELKGFEVVYNTFVKDNDVENHYFKYVINKENKTIEISETYNNEGECSANITFKKRFKKKKERYVVSYDPAIGKDSTVVATIPAKGSDFDKDKKDMKKINIAEKLKHCKKGTKLYHLMFGEVEFDNADENYITITTTDKDNNKNKYFANIYGIYAEDYPDAECLLFPSKDNRDWNNFQVLEKGHRVMCSDDALYWVLAIYLEDNAVKTFTKDTKCYWKHIVPVEDFDFTAEDITINVEKSIV